VINYLVKRDFADTMEPLLFEWTDSLANRFRFIHYEELPDLRAIPAGTIIFADVERLSPSETELAAAVRDLSVSQLPETPILNDPERTLRRFDLLDRLHKEKFNTFRAYRLTDTTVPERFPVFLRYESDHTGAMYGLLPDQTAVDTAIVRAMIRGHRLSNLLMVEFVDTSSDDGLYRKYAAYIVGDRIIPADVIVEHDWHVKGNGIGAQDLVDAELDYIGADPHASQLKEIADLANVQYGRIDYALTDNRVVTWEINTNPFILWTKERVPWWMRPKLEHFIPALIDAFIAVDAQPTDGELSLAEVDPDLRERARGRAAQHGSGPARRFGQQYKRLLDPAVDVVEALAVPFRRQIIGAWKRTNSNQQ